MKKILLIAGAICMSWLVSAQDQESTPKTVVGIKAGLNASIFSASFNSDPSFRTGFHFGVYLRNSLGKNFYLRPELYYSSQGQKDNYQSFSGQSVGKTTTSVDYLNIPVLFEVGRKVTFQFGPQVGVLLSAHEKGTIDNKKVNDDLKEIMKPIDFSLVLGVGFHAKSGFNAGIRFNKGLANIFDTSGGTPTVKNQVFHFYIAHSF